MALSKVNPNFVNVSQYGRRNLIINGAMQVAQRGTSRSFGGTYNTLDRWAMGQYQQAGHEQVSVTDTSVPVKKAIKVTSSSTSEAGSGTRMALAQIVESQNCDFLAGKTVTLSFYIRFSDATMTGGGDFLFQLNEYDSVDPNLLTTGATRENNTTIAQGSLPTSWTKYTKTITCSSTMKNLGARFLFSNLFNTTANSDEWYEVTGVQLEAGDTATPFEHRSYGEELALCQRYFWNQVHQSSDAMVMDGFWGSATIFEGTVRYPVPMRAAPSLSTTSIGNIAALNPQTAWYAASSVVIDFSSGVYASKLTFQVANSGLAKGVGGVLALRGAGASVSFTAEL